METNFLISIGTLIISFSAFVFSIYSYRQASVIPKRNSSLNSLINILTDEINFRKVYKKDFQNEEEYYNYMFYINMMDENSIEVYERWKPILINFKYSSNYKFLPEIAKNEFDELLNETFYDFNMSFEEYVLKLERKRKIMIELLI